MKFSRAAIVFCAAALGHESEMRELPQSPNPGGDRLAATSFVVDTITESMSSGAGCYGALLLIPVGGIPVC
jgi:hypothetical protein